jgi:outer membrane biosynthesis protein TonB
MKNPDDRAGLALSVTAHVLILLVLAFAAAAPTETLKPDYPRPIVEVDFIPLAPTLPVQVGEPQSAPEAAPAAAAQQPEPERPAPPAATPVRVPERTRATPPRANPLPRPTPQPEARPSRPSPPSPRTRPEPRPTAPRNPAPTQGSGTTQGTATTTGATEGTGAGTGGDAPAEVGFNFGNRSFNCPTPPNPGVNGSVTFRVTFAPNGRYQSARPTSRNSELESLARQVLSSCRADPLPPNARQVPQATNATFRFTADG